MDDRRQIESLFETISIKYGKVSPETKKIFGVLVEETLKYRDELHAKTGHTLSIAEVQETLSVLDQLLLKKSAPAINNTQVAALLERLIKRLSGK